MLRFHTLFGFVCRISLIEILTVLWRRRPGMVVCYTDSLTLDGLETVASLPAAFHVMLAMSS